MVDLKYIDSGFSKYNLQQRYLSAHFQLKKYPHHSLYMSCICLTGSLEELGPGFIRFPRPSEGSNWIKFFFQCFPPEPDHGDDRNPFCFDYHCLSRAL